MTLLLIYSFFSNTVRSSLFISFAHRPWCNTRCCLSIRIAFVVDGALQLTAFGAKTHDVDAFASENNANTNSVDPFDAYAMQNHQNNQLFDQFGNQAGPQYYPNGSPTYPPVPPLRQRQLQSQVTPNNNQPTWAPRPPQVAQQTPTPALNSRQQLAHAHALRGRRQTEMAKTRKQDEDDKADKAAAGNSGQLAQKAERPDPVYNGVSYNMPTNVKDLQKHLRQFVQRLETARVKNKTLAQQNAEYREQIKDMHKVAMKTRKNTAVVGKIKKIYRSHLFRETKFIQDTVDEGIASALAYDIVYTKSEAKKLPKDHKIIWTNTYGPSVTSVANARRSYIQARMKDATMKFAEEKKIIPTLEQVTKCAMRTIDIDKPEGFAIMKWYWTEMMRKYLLIDVLIDDLC